MSFLELIIKAKLQQTLRFTVQKYMSLSEILSPHNKRNREHFLYPSLNRISFM